jgi:hypothetical protein
MNMEHEESEPYMAYMSAHISQTVQKNDEQKKWSRVLGRKKPTVSSKKRGNARSASGKAKHQVLHLLKPLY